MKAGEELDSLVASEVMNMFPCDKWEYMSLGTAGGPVFIKKCKHTNCYPKQYIESIHGRIGGLPQFSSRPIYALTVWQKIRDTNEFCCLNINSDYSYIYRIELIKEDLTGKSKHEPCVIVEDEDFCVAICKAALLGMNIINQNK